MNNWRNDLQAVERLGEIEQSIGLKLVANGPPQAFPGELCSILDAEHNFLMQAEVIGFDQGKVYLLPFTTAPVSMGFKVRASGQPITVAVGQDLPGQIVDAFARPLNGSQTLSCSLQVALHSPKTNPLHRAAVNQRLQTGIHAIDCLLPLGKGQRMGLFAGSGVGKSVLLGMMARHLDSDINVIALIGERGREVKDFIQTHLDESTRRKSVVVVACSDDFALMRRQAIYTATAIAEYFCNQGKDVMLFVDSITRFAMAQREIGLSLGEPPTARGYTPTVFSLLPAITERAGNFMGKGSITALYTVLVEGDDFNEPLADTMRSLLDGHIILTRELAHSGHYPAIDVLQSVSRLSSQLTSSSEQLLIRKAFSLLSLYRQNQDLINLGACKPGQSAQLDYAMERIDALQKLLTQNTDKPLSIPQLFRKLQDILE